MAEDKKTTEDRFRSSLADLVVVIEKLSPFCKTLEELSGMLSLASENDAQLSILMTLVMGKPK